MYVLLVYMAVSVCVPRDDGRRTADDDVDSDDVLVRKTTLGQIYKKLKKPNRNRLAARTSQQWERDEKRREEKIYLFDSV